MREFHGLRPEDFQKAWPAAYSLAVEQVVSLHHQAVHQMSTATEQVLLGQRAAARSARMLNDSKDAILADIRRAHSDAQDRMHALSDSVDRGLADLILRERAFENALVREKCALQKSQSELRSAQDAFQKSPLWKRLMWAFKPHLIFK